MFHLQFDVASPMRFYHLKCEFMIELQGSFLWQRHMASFLYSSSELVNCMNHSAHIHYMGNGKAPKLTSQLYETVPKSSLASTKPDRLQYQVENN
jgi:hypothetical protein